jgi:purine-nucleoside phosphorylase
MSSSTGEEFRLGYEEVQAAAQSVVQKLALSIRPRIGVVLGSGLGELEQRIEEKHALPYSQITHMPSPSVLGHGGQLITGKLGGQPVVCLSGRVHLYEGHTPDKVVFGVRLLAALGVEVLIVTNASGGIAPECGPGVFMLITDHINFTGQNPLNGKNDPRFGVRFPDMSQTYDLSLQGLARNVAQERTLPLVQGVYAGVLGPSYETPAEIAMLKQWGASAVGMSTVHEVIAARHLGVRILGISCITNYAAGRAPGELKHDDVAKEAQKSGGAFCDLVETICSKIT